MKNTDDEIPQPYRDFVTYFLDEESGCQQYMAEHPNVYNTISLSLLPEDINDPHDIPPENKYIFRNPDYKSKTDSEENPLNLLPIYKYAIGDRFFDNVFSRCDQYPKFNSISIQGETGFQETDQPANCLEIIPTDEEKLSSRFVCPDPDRQQRPLYNRFDLEYNQRCPRYLKDLETNYKNKSVDYCVHFPKIVSENFLVLDECPRESVLGKDGPFKDKTKRQLLWDPSKKQLNCQVYDDKTGWGYPIYSTK